MRELPGLNKGGSAVKKILVLMACAVVLMAAGSAMAATDLLGPHKTDANNPCKVCHDTASGTPALRGWAGTNAGPTTGWGGKAISALCYMCHSTGNTYSATDQTANAYSDGNHKYQEGTYPEMPEGTTDPAIGLSNLPYTIGWAAGSEIECTSCHNVHVSSSRPFNQRASWQAMCDECHPGRVNNTAGRTTAGTARSYSTHPTQQPLGDQGAANIKAEGAIDAYMRTAIGAAYALGGHLGLSTGTGDTGDMDCTTCHAVHGPQQDNTSSYDDYLAYDNTTPASIPGTGPLNLCEGCHFGGAEGEQVGSNVTTPVEDSDHPIDTRVGRAFYPTGVDVPALWVGGGENNDRGPQSFYPSSGPLTPVCSSCHDTHGGIAGQAILRGPITAAGDYTFSYGAWCFVCHTADQVIPLNHHSNLQNMNGEDVSQLDCGDCHGNQTGNEDWRAHNGFWGWPAGTEPSLVNSAICEGCHTPDDPTNLVAPALKGQTFNEAWPGDFVSTHGANRGTGAGSSHQINEAPDGTNDNLDTTPDWSGHSNGTSQWGAGGEIICESCHNILTNGVSTDQGLTQGWKANLLLAPYEDDATGTGAGEGADDYYGDTTYGAGATGVDFCRGCHDGAGQGNAGFVHNPAAHTVAGYTYPATSTPYGRTTDTVLTTTAACPENTTADMAGAPGVLSYPAADAVDCDSCHRPHNADPDSFDSSASNRYLILETTDSNWGTTICAQCHDTTVQCNQ